VHTLFCTLCMASCRQCVRVQPTLSCQTSTGRGGKACRLHLHNMPGMHWLVAHVTPESESTWGLHALRALNICALGVHACVGGAQDMAPYVGLLMPELQAAVVDPLPEVRATAARALGSLLRGMGAEHFTELVPWLLATLRSEVHTPFTCSFLWLLPSGHAAAAASILS